MFLVQTNIRVHPTKNINQTRKRDKKYHCLFCGEEVAQLPRHLYSIHADEHEVIEILASSDSSQRSRLLTKLRNMGNHKHNLATLRAGTGKLAVVYRPWRLYKIHPLPQTWPWHNCAVAR